ncbi:heterokaryon incompatibility protein-domain-containing protein [Xylaria telfairii]|nr:heterokaryon incompatibility protein-domain-containing protein [Xylaria telfairii]
MDDNTSAPVAPSDGDTGPQITDGYKSPKPYPYYNYTALPKGWIRLVQIHGDSLDETLENDLDADLHVTLHDYPLSSCPDYIALSYTWGEPSGKADPTYRIFSQEPRCFPINCGGHLLRGTRNLRSVLRRLRQAQQILKNVDALDLSPDFAKALDEDPDSCIFLDFYWIDALCIDQDDLFERSTQVSQMGEIYKKTRQCVVWLGEQSDYTNSAMGLVMDIANNDEIVDDFKEGVKSATMEAKSKFRRRFNYIMRGLPKERVVELALLLSHAWFSRVWVLQEVALAPKVIVQCGSQRSNFGVLLRLGQLIGVARGGYSLTEIVTFDIAQQHGIRAPGTPGSFTEAQMTLTGLAMVRRQLKERSMPTVFDVMAMASQSESSDPRDRIYGVLAITAEFQSDSGNTIYPDYTLPVHVVYVKATSQIASRHNHLGFLSVVCQKERKNINGLPSWCPDYTHLAVDLFALGSDADDGKYAASLWGRQPDIKVVDDKLLAVHGFCYDAVDEVTYDVRGLLSLALNISRNKYGGQLRRGTLIDSLWRVLIRDQFCDVTPAPKVVGLYFPVILGILPVPRSKQQEVAKRETSDWLRIVTELRSLEPESCPFLPDSNLIREIFGEENLNTDKAYKKAYIAREMASVERRAVEAGLMPEFEQFLGPDLADTSERDFAYRAAVMFRDNLAHEVTKLARDKPYFSTEKTARFGLASSSVKTGDQVWILHGASTPVLLRPLENGNYEFLGATYIQGIMGDAIKDDFRTEGQEIQRISIE